MLQVFVRNIECYGYHGWTAEERVVGHRLRISIVADVLSPTHGGDTFTVSYADLAELAVQRNAAKSYRTLEQLASDLCLDIFDAHSAVDGLEITIEKVAPPFSTIAESAGICLAVNRESLTR